MRYRLIAYVVALLAAAPVLSGCPREPVDTPGESASAARESPAPSDRIDMPDTVRKNLGITFAKVESRNVARTIRVPGRFEIAPNALREYHTMLGGRVEIRVAQYDRVAPGQVLYTLDSPAWRALQQEMSGTEMAIHQAVARVATIAPLMAAHKDHEESLRSAVEVWTERVRQLEQSSSGVITAEDLAQARGMMTSNRSELSEVFEKQAELDARRIEVQSELFAAKERFELQMMVAATLLGMDAVALLAPADSTLERHLHAAHATDGASQPHAVWREIQIVEVRAAAPGVVQSMALTNGAWAAETDLVLTTVEPEKIRFRARGLQSDLGRLRDGLVARVVPPAGGSIAMQDTMEGVISLGLLADADERTVDILMTPDKPASWARAGVAAHLEIVAEGAGEPELAIPISATIRDGLQTIFFRRDPKDANKVIRVEADLGVSDGRWVAVHSGVREGDEVVMDGIYPLMLATSGSAQKGGHFHADGEFHEGKD